MLILSRRIGETLIVGDNIAVTVLSIRGGQVRIGIAAPPHIAVHRQEVVDRAATDSLPSFAKLGPKTSNG
jgi:carbon storage regulator